MTVTPSITPSAFNLVQIGGVDQYGTRITQFGLQKEFATFEDEEAGLLAAHVTPPTIIKQNPALVWAGRLNALCDGELIGMCLDADGTLSWDALNTIVDKVFVYGDASTAGAGTGWQTTGCFGERLRITARPNTMIEFTASLRGQVTTKKTDATIDVTPSGTEFYPFERAVFSIGTAFGTYSAAAKLCLGLTMDMVTGYFPVFTPDGNAYYSDIGERKTKAMILDLILGDNAAAVAEYDKYADGNPTSIKFLMTSHGGSNTCTIEAYGHYLAWDMAGQDGLSTHRARFVSTFDPSNSDVYAMAST